MNTITIRHIYPNEYNTVIALISDSFGRDKHDEHALTDYWQTYLPHKPTTKLEDYRAIVRETEQHGHEVIAFARLEQRQLYYGRTLLRVVLISDVCTHPDYRHQGYSSALMRDTLAYLAEQGGHIAMLYDPATYYQQYGFNPLFPQYQLHIKHQAIHDWLASHTSPECDEATVRHATRDDLPDIAHLYERHWRSRITLHRDASLWKWLLMTQESQVHVVIEKGHITGYLWHHPRSNRTEVIADTAGATCALLAFDSHAHVTPRHSTHSADDVLIWDVPPDDVVIAYASMWLPLELRVLSHPDSGWLGRLIDTNALLNAISPELRAGISAGTHDIGIHNHLMLSAEPDEIILAWHNDVLPTIRIQHRDFLPLLFGSLRPTTLALRQKISAQQADILAQAFPQRIASIGAWDM